MDAATQERLLAQWNAANKPAAALEPSIAPEVNQKLIDRWNKREKYLKDTGGFGGGTKRFVDSAMNALTTEMPIGVAQALGTADPAALNRMRAENEHLTATNVGRLGNVVGASVLPMAVGAGVGSGLKLVPGMANMNVVRNAVGGGASGAVLPTLEGESRGKNIAVNAALSAAPSAVKKIFAQPITPTADAQRLISEGIYPTPGQAHGGWLNRLESATTSHPIFGAMVSEARSKPFQSYVGRRQKTFGYEGDKLGRDAAEEMAAESDRRYNQVIPKLMLEDTPALRAKYLRAQSELEPGSPGFNDVTRMISRKFDPLFENNPSRIIGGEDLNKWQSQLRVRGEKASRGDDVFQNDLGDTYARMRNDTLDEIENQGLVGGTVPQEFRNAREYYGKMKDLMELNSTGGARTRNGMFTPAEDLRWMEKSNPTAFERNAVQDQQLAQSAKNSLGDVPDSGTAGRLAMLEFLKDPKQILNPMTYASLPLTAGAWEPVRKFAVGAYAPQRAISKALRAFDNPLVAQPLGTLETEGVAEYNR